LLPSRDGRALYVELARANLVRTFSMLVYKVGYEAPLRVERRNP
jgi:hypothetical protein